MPKPTIDCSICCLATNKSDRKPIHCASCDILTCRTCFEKYLLQTADPHCMGCKKSFTIEFLHSQLTATWMNKEYKKHRETILFDHEKSMLAETQPYVITERQRQVHLNKIELLREERNKLMKQVRELDSQIWREQSSINLLIRRNQNTTISTERRQFIHKCPIENCRGFLSTKWECGSCEARICSQCNERKDDEHECDPNNVANMELIKKDSRPCPKCSMMIFKIVGCSMMFCTSCHTPWDWNTGRVVETGHIHNPHYYEFIRNGGGGGQNPRHRNPNDIPCGGLPDVYELRTAIRNESNTIQNTLYYIHRIVSHIQGVEMRTYNNDQIAYNRGLRVKYLLNQIDENHFKSLLVANEKKRQKIVDYHAVYQLFINVCSDIFREIVINKGGIGDIRRLVQHSLDSITRLINYFNETFAKLGKQYKCVYPAIVLEDKYMFTSNYVRYMFNKKQQQTNN